MDVIRKLRRITGIQKIGHAGTLDPLATGVLLVCLGKATKKIEALMATTKKYTATINLSAFSSTDDAEGELSPIAIEQPPNQETIVATLEQFIGTYEQTPPIYSAIKIGGKAAYRWAREGKSVPIASRLVTIDSIHLVAYSFPELTIEIVCGKGTYIRSLARDIGKALKTGGYLTGLIRTQVGPYTLEQALAIEHLENLTESALIPLE